MCTRARAKDGRAAVQKPTANHAGPSSPPKNSEASENLSDSLDLSFFPNLTDRVSHSDLWLILQLLQQRTQLQFPWGASFGQRGPRGSGQQAGAHCRLLQRSGRWWRRLWWLLLQLRLTWLWISLRAGVEPVRLGRLLLLLHLLHLQQLVLLILSPCSAVQHGHSDSSAAEPQQQPQQQQQRVRRVSLPQLPVLLPVQHARAGKLQRAGVSQLHLRQVCSHFLPVLSLSTRVRTPH